MSVKAIRLQNFMAFEDTGWIEFRPITLLFGRNSSGKSAIIRALRLLKQSLYASPTDGPLVFVAEQGLDQGSFLETVHHQKMDQPILFHFRCWLGKSLDGLIEVLTNSQRIGLSATTNIQEQNNWDLSLGFTWDQKASQVELSLLRIAWALRADYSVTVLAAEKLADDSFRVESELLAGGSNDKQALWRKAILSLTSSFWPSLNGFQIMESEPRAALEDLALAKDLLNQLGQSVRAFLEEIEYLGPIRPEPQRIYTLDRLFRQRLLKRGLSAWLDFLGDEVAQEKVGQIKRWVQHLGLAEEIELEKTQLKRTPVTISALRVYEVDAAPRQRGTSSLNLKDIGYGASQVLPVIVQSTLAKKGALLMIEQPELHLHPRAQAQMADLFIDAIGSHASVAHKQDEAEEDIARAPCFLLETHSEYLLLRLRRRIAETSNRNNSNSTDANLGLRPDDLAVYFVHRVDGISSVEEIKISHYGEFLNVPEGFGDFFSDDLIETAKLAQERLRAGLMWRKPSHDSSN